MLNGSAAKRRDWTVKQAKKMKERILTGKATRIDPE
jgi:hypothetical protein